MNKQYPNFGEAIVNLSNALKASKTIKEEHLLDEHIENSHYIFEPIVKAAVGQFLNEIAIHAVEYLEENADTECEEEIKYS